MANKLGAVLLVILLCVGCAEKKKQIPKPSPAIEMYEVTIPPECIDLLSCGKDVTCRKHAKVWFHCTKVSRPEVPK